MNLFKASCFIFSLVCLLTLSSKLMASVPIAPITITLKQPNGVTFLAFPKGTIYKNWIETASKHTIIKNNNTWFYAIKTKNGSLTPSTFIVGSLSNEALNAIPKNIRPPNKINTEVHTIKYSQPKKVNLKKTTNNFQTKKKQPELQFVEQIKPKTDINNLTSFSPLNPPYSTSNKFSNTTSNTTSQNVLIILVSFANKAFTYSVSDFNSLIFGASASVKDYFLENSYNDFIITAAIESDSSNSGAINDGIISVTLAINHPNSGDNFNALDTSLIAAVTATDAFIDYSSFDNNGDGSVSPNELSIVFIYAGYEAAFAGGGGLTPNIWGHKSKFTPTSLDNVNLNNYVALGEQHASSVTDTRIATIGIMAHELGHLMLALPDLYDTDGSSNGIGSWGLMSWGGWNYTTFPGDSPAHLLGWSKAQAGMIKLTNATSNLTAKSLTETNSNNSYLRVWLDRYRINEHFILENRQQNNYDTRLASSGLLITHINPKRTSNTNENNKLVDIEEADGLRQLDFSVNIGNSGDLFPGSSLKTNFSRQTNPNSKLRNGSNSGVSVSNITMNNGNILVDVIPSNVGQGDHIRYDVSDNKSNYGYSNVEVWTALKFTNNTMFDAIEGFEIILNDSATVDAYFYKSIQGGVPTTLVSSQLGFTGTIGTNRYLFSNKTIFSKNSDIVMVLKITNETYRWPATTDKIAVAGRSWINNSINGVFTAVAPTGEFNQHLLLGATEDNSFKIIKLKSNKVLVLP